MRRMQNDSGLTTNVNSDMTTNSRRSNAVQWPQSMRPTKTQFKP